MASIDSDKSVRVSTTLTNVSDLGVWQLQLNIALAAKHPLCLKACEPFPTGKADDPSADPAIPDTATDDQQRYAAKACHIILSSISANIQQALFVNGSTTPITNPRYLLQRIYEYLRPRDDATLLQEEAKFEHITKRPTEDVTSYAARLESQASIVNSLGGSVQERNKIARFKWGLMEDSDWSPWLASQDAAISSPASFSALLMSARAWEHTLRLRAELKPAREALLALPRGTKPPPRNTCERCGEPGHDAANCWKPLTRDDIRARQQQRQRRDHDPRRQQPPRRDNKPRDDKPRDNPRDKPKPPSPCPNCKGDHWKSDCTAPPKQKNNNQVAFTVQPTDYNLPFPHYIIDSGATVHVANNLDLLRNYTDTNTTLTGVGGQQLSVTAKGTLRDYPGEVYYAPSAAANILSVDQLVNHGWTVRFAKQHVYITTDQGIQIDAPRCLDKLYRLDHTAFIAMPSNDITYWHRTFGHISDANLRATAKLYNIDTSSWPATLPPCTACIEGNMRRAPISRQDYNPQRDPDLKPGQRLHIDFVGPVFRDNSYILNCVDESTRYAMSDKARNRNLAPQIMADIITHNISPRQHQPAEIHSDYAPELSGSDWQEFTTEWGIRVSHSSPHTPEHNGIAERTHGIIIAHARAMLADAGLDHKDPTIGYAAYKHAEFLHNITPTRALPKGMTPFEAFHGFSPRVSEMTLLPFGTPVFFYSPEKAKFGKRAIAGHYMGPDTTTPGGAIRVLSSESGRIKTERTFKLAPIAPTTSSVAPQPAPPQQLHTDSDSDSDDEGFAETTTRHAPSRRDSADDQYFTPPNNAALPTPNQTPAQPQQQQQPPARRPSVKGLRERQALRDTPEYARAPAAITARSLRSAARTVEGEPSTGGHALLATTDPSNYAEAMASPDAKHWQEAINRETSGLYHRDVFGIIHRSTIADKKIKPIPSGYVYKTKTDDNNNIDHKARLVARGNLQRPGIDYYATSAPVAAREHIRTVLAIAAQEGYNIRQFDATQAYVNADIDTDIYIEIPDGAAAALDPIVSEHERNILRSGHAVLQLKKALYGLKQSGLLWYDTIRTALANMDFTPTDTDPCVFHDRDSNILVLYVDDGLLFTRTTSAADRILQQLQQHFPIKDLGIPKTFLGWRIHVNHDHHEIFINQSNYARDLGNKYAAGLPPKATPLIHGADIDANGPPCDKDKYAEINGSNNYLAQCTRPDIALAVSILSRHLASPTKAALKAARNTASYAAATADYGLLYTRADKLSLSVYCDASFAPDENNRKSRTGYIIFINNTPVAWKSQQQPIIAHSTAEAEYIAMSEAVREATAIKRLLTELGHHITDPIKTLEDNQVAQRMADEITTKRSKHIDIRYHYVRDAAARNIIEIEYCPTADQLADILTKALPRDAFQRLRDRFMVKGE